MRDKRRARYREGMYVLEGQRLVSHALARGHCPSFVLLTDEFASGAPGAQVVRALADASVETWFVDEPLLASVSDTVSPQGILAVLELPPRDLDWCAGASLLLIVDGVRDPGNLGTMLRTAHAAGMDGALLSVGTVDPFSPKVVRAGMGAHLDLSVVPDGDWGEVAGHVSEMQCVLADAEGSRAVWDIDWTLPSALIIGSEAWGPGPEARALSSVAASLPMAEGAESLNAAIAMGAFAFEAARQRRTAG